MIKGKGNEQKCSTCKKYAGGCNWTDYDPETGRTKFQPVEGWHAVPTKIISCGEVIDSFHIIDCPEHEPDGSEKRKMELSSSLKWDIEKFLLCVHAGMTENEIRRRMGGMPKSTITIYKRMLRKAGRL